MAVDRLTKSFPVFQAYENYPALPQTYVHLVQHEQNI